MDVTAKYELIGLRAYPIRHSLSPEMQNKALVLSSIIYGVPDRYGSFSGSFTRSFQVLLSYRGSMWSPAD